jgi:hypothetical protein
VEVASIDQTFHQAKTIGFLLSEKTLRPLPWRDLNDSLQHETLRRRRRSPSGPALTKLLATQRAPAPFAARVSVPNKESEQRNASLCLSRYGGTASHVMREWLNCSTGSVSANTRCPVLLGPFVQLKAQHSYFRQPPTPRAKGTDSRRSTRDAKRTCPAPARNADDRVGHVPVTPHPLRAQLLNPAFPLSTALTSAHGLGLRRKRT